MTQPFQPTHPPDKRQDQNTGTPQWQTVDPQTRELKVLATQLNLPFQELTNFTPSNEILNAIPFDLQHKYAILPLEASGQTISIATSTPLNLEIEQTLSAATGKSIHLVVSTRTDIQNAQQRSEGATKILNNISQDFRPTLVKENQAGQEVAIDLNKIGKDAAPVIRLVNNILIDALQKRASDIHIQAEQTHIDVTYRIDGVLYPAMDPLDFKHHPALVSRLKVMSELDIAERRIPQDGRFKLRLDKQDIDFRVSVLPGIFGEDIVIRILDKSHISQEDSLSLAGLGFEGDHLNRLRRAIHAPHGMILITGPTGSGKTTTLYASLCEIHTGNEKIITIEDPVEYELPGILQIAVNEKKQLTFAKGLRSILRHDPDKIMVGEIRDTETAAIAVQSALTGHLVFTTIHANNVFDVVNRFCHMGIDRYNLVAALNSVMAQRLVRKICPHCKETIHYSEAELKSLGIAVPENSPNIWFKGKGCDQCLGTGYYGRLAVVEYLDISPTIAEHIINQRPFQELYRTALNEGMVPLREAAILKARAGHTSLEEVNRVTTHNAER